VKVGVVGTGALGRHHVRILAEDPAADLVGIFDTDRAVAERVGSEFGAEVFDDLDSLAEGLEAAVVAVPTVDHCEVGCNFDIAIADDYTERGYPCHDSGDGVGEEKDTRKPFTSKRGLERPECKCTDYYWVEYPDLDRCICACNVNNHEDNVDKRDSEDGERADSVDRQGQEGVGIGFLKSCMRYAKPVALAGLAGGVLGAAGIYLWFKYKR